MERGDTKLSSSHRRAPKQERELSKKVGGRLTPASGSRDEKGDVRLKSVARIECKTTSKDSFSITKALIHKIEAAAMPAGELPVIVVEFNDGSSTARKLAEVAVLPMWALEALLENKVI